VGAVAARPASGRGTAAAALPLGPTGRGAAARHNAEVQVQGRNTWRRTLTIGMAPNGFGRGGGDAGLFRGCSGRWAPPPPPAAWGPWQHDHRPSIGRGWGGYVLAVFSQFVSATLGGRDNAGAARSCLGRAVPLGTGLWPWAPDRRRGVIPPARTCRGRGHPLGARSCLERVVPLHPRGKLQLRVPSIVRVARPAVVFVLGEPTPVCPADRPSNRDESRGLRWAISGWDGARHPWEAALVAASPPRRPPPRSSASVVPSSRATTSQRMRDLWAKKKSTRPHPRLQLLTLHYIASTLSIILCLPPLFSTP
jgi:hypothetical protein